MAEPLYDVTTWDCERQDYTPDDGLNAPSQGIPITGVRRVLRELRSAGYNCRYRSCWLLDNDPSVLVERL